MERLACSHLWFRFRSCIIGWNQIRNRFISFSGFLCWKLIWRCLRFYNLRRSGRDLLRFDAQLWCGIWFSSTRDPWRILFSRRQPGQCHTISCFQVCRRGLFLLLRHLIRQRRCQVCLLGALLTLAFGTFTSILLSSRLLDLEFQCCLRLLPIPQVQFLS